MPDLSEEARRTRLPQWAQRRLAVLERDLASARARLSEGPADADTLVVGYSGPDRPLGKGTTVRFLTGPGLCYIEANARDGEVHIRSAGGRLLIRPEVGNVIRAAVDPR